MAGNVSIGGAHVQVQSQANEANLRCAVFLRTQPPQVLQDVLLWALASI